MHRRVSKTFDYENDPHEWSDQRTIKCLGQTRDGSIRSSGFSILSPDHLDEEINRLRNDNDVLDGPACAACGTCLLDRPDECALNGALNAPGVEMAKPVRRNVAPKSIRVVHTPCKGKKGARFSVSVPHASQETSSDNLEILAAVRKSAGIIDIKRIVGMVAKGKKAGISRIHDRFAWLEQVFLACEREMLRRWKDKVERSNQPVEHLLSHDDMVLTVNRETATDRRNTLLNCTVTADARTGYVYRLDVDFDPRVKPLELFNATHLDEQGGPKNLWQQYPTGKIRSAPKFSWQRPTGRLHKCENASCPAGVAVPDCSNIDCLTFPD